MYKKHLSIKDFLELQNRKSEIFRKKSEDGTIPLDLIWIDNFEFMDLLQISRKTTQNYRERMLIGYSVLGGRNGRGGRVYYKLSDVLALLEKNYKSIDYP